MRAPFAIIAVIACSGDRTPAPPPTSSPSPSSIRTADAAVAAEAPDAAITLDPALAAVIDRRIAQTAPKMRLMQQEGEQVKAAVVAVQERPPVRALARVMPRSTVELARAVAERGVPIDELDRIAAYLVRVVEAIEPERLATFDDNHSHVTGRDWHEIDYGGESMTWQGQRDAWVPKGVKSFKRAEYIHAYFVGAEKLAHWDRVYRPRGRMAAVTPP